MSIRVSVILVLLLSCFLIILSSYRVTGLLTSAFNDRQRLNLNHQRIDYSLFNPVMIIAFYLFIAMAVVLIKIFYGVGESLKGFHLQIITGTMVTSILVLVIIWSYKTSQLSNHKFNFLCVLLNITLTWSLMLYVSFMMVGIFGKQAYLN